MSDELRRRRRSCRPSHAVVVCAGRSRASALRLLVRLYSSANLVLRARLVDCPVRPLGPARRSPASRRGRSARSPCAAARGGSRDRDRPTSRALPRNRSPSWRASSSRSSPEALQQAAQLVADNPLGVGAFTVSVAVLLAPASRAAGACGAPRASRSGRRAT